MNIDKIIANYYKNPENKKIAEQANTQEESKDYRVYKVIKTDNTYITIYNNGTFSIDKITEV